MYDIEFRLQHAFSYTADLQSPPEVIGPVPEGFRANFYITGGVVEGPMLRGRIRPVGADWLTIRPDGVGILDVRATFETEDNALIDVRLPGMAELGKDGYQDALQGKFPKTVKLRAMPRLSTSHARHEWLNRAPIVMVGEVDLELFKVRWNAYLLD